MREGGREMYGRGVKSMRKKREVRSVVQAPGQTGARSFREKGKSAGRSRHVHDLTSPHITSPHLILSGQSAGWLDMKSNVILQS